MRRPLTQSLILCLLLAGNLDARTLLTQKQALADVFPGGTNVVRETFYLTASELAAVRISSGSDVRSQLVIRYRGVVDGKELHVYFDSHQVRTLPETVMIVLTPDQTIDRIEILSFNEPMDYFPRARWLDQFRKRGLNEDLSLRRSIRPMTGASLTGKAIMDASRRVLAVHSIVESKRRAGDTPAR